MAQAPPPWVRPRRRGQRTQAHTTSSVRLVRQIVSQLVATTNVLLLTKCCTTYFCQEQRPLVPPGMSNAVREKHLGEITPQLCPGPSPDSSPGPSPDSSPDSSPGSSPGSSPRLSPGSITYGCRPAVEGAPLCRARKLQNGHDAPTHDGARRKARLGIYPHVYIHHLPPPPLTLTLTLTRLSLSPSLTLTLPWP